MRILPLALAAIACTFASIAEAGGARHHGHQFGRSTVVIVPPTSRVIIVPRVHRSPLSTFPPTVLHPRVHRFEHFSWPRSWSTPTPHVWQLHPRWSNPHVQPWTHSWTSPRMHSHAFGWSGQSRGSWRSHRRW